MSIRWHCWGEIKAGQKNRWKRKTPTKKAEQGRGMLEREREGRLVEIRERV